MVDDLKYQKPDLTLASESGELFTLKLRYKAPDGDTSRLLSYAVANDDLRMASASDDCSPALQES